MLLRDAEKLLETPYIGFIISQVHAMLRQMPVDLKLISPNTKLGL